MSERDIPMFHICRVFLSTHHYSITQMNVDKDNLAIVSGILNGRLLLGISAFHRMGPHIPINNNQLKKIYLAVYSVVWRYSITRAATSKENQFLYIKSHN